MRADLRKQLTVAERACGAAAVRHSAAVEERAMAMARREQVAQRIASASKALEATASRLFTDDGEQAFRTAAADKMIEEARLASIDTVALPHLTAAVDTAAAEVRAARRDVDLARVKVGVAEDLLPKVKLMAEHLQLGSELLEECRTIMRDLRAMGADCLEGLPAGNPMAPNWLNHAIPPFIRRLVREAPDINFPYSPNVASEWARRFFGEDIDVD